MKPSKALSRNFLNNELKKKAKEKSLKSLPEQAQVKKADIAKVKVKNAKSNKSQG